MGIFDMGIFDFFKKSKSSNIAKERLMMVLSYERKGLPTNFADALKDDLVDVFAKYPQLSVDEIDINFDTVGETEQLFISVPFSTNGK